jgi:hypothetical protein
MSNLGPSPNMTSWLHCIFLSHWIPFSSCMVPIYCRIWKFINIIALLIPAIWSHWMPHGGWKHTKGT